MSSATQSTIVVVSVGTRGDIQPYCILGQALAKRGHHVVVATEKRLEAFVASEYGLPVRCLDGDSVGGLFDADFQRRLRDAKFLEMFALFDSWMDQFDPTVILQSYAAALAGADMVITGPLTLVQSYSVAEQLHATWVPVFLGTLPLPTSEFPHLLLEDFTFASRWLNRVSHALIWSALWSKLQRPVNAWRQTSLQLPPIQSSYGVLDVILANDSVTVYQACSLLFCGPNRRLPLDYAIGKVDFTGFLFPDSELNTTGSVALEDFLRASALPVIYIGFGSMPTLEPAALLRLAIDVCAMANCRCVLVTGWTAVGDVEVARQEASSTVHVEASVSHPWLFPQMACILHHAGIGTVAAALRSGVPQIPCPLLLDQFHNANEVVALGVAPCAIPKTKMTAAHVGDAVQRVLRNEDNIQTKANRLGTYVTKESNGAVDRLCGLILATSPTFG
ncbi:Aste57867_18001 [Aphanomyces stellatus]|uniref:Aste57867_18001 protein n=1 Tax=Aphanomyces stellatus TaxID=120398 RepID=A0A485LAK3_9STRA|nr:hypothetical protein As57867_017939 [Aphanomyces stellatus]VFT94740.1 Aste57867_18001 [Aphanomyces stellatus]